MRFIDEVRITVASGAGGDGRVGFRREKFVPRGGPDGGDGGRGGHVVLRADPGHNTLVRFRGRKLHEAPRGGDGGGGRRHGRNGRDLLLRVPVGTVVRDAGPGTVLADLAEPGQEVLVARGGRGGLGNERFKGPADRAPRRATPGGPGQTVELDLELKLLADVSIIGMPNVGKSTLVAAVSRARPKIADYEFTTLQPNLGVVVHGGGSFVVADIPGLIRGASLGRGLGTRFLRHIERTRAFVHVVDVSWCLEPFEALDSYATVRNELERHDAALLDKREIVCLSKTDALREDEVRAFQDLFREQVGVVPLAVSAVARRGIGRLKALMAGSLTGAPGGAPSERARTRGAHKAP